MTLMSRRQQSDKRAILKVHFPRHKTVLKEEGNVNYSFGEGLS